MISKNMERYDVEEYGKIYDMVVCDGYWFQLVSTAFKGFKILFRHLLRVLSCSTPFQALNKCQLPCSKESRNNKNLSSEEPDLYKTWFCELWTLHCAKTDDIADGDPWIPSWWKALRVDGWGFLFLSSSLELDTKCKETTEHKWTEMDTNRQSKK